MTWQWVVLILGLAIVFAAATCVMSHLSNDMVRINNDRVNNADDH